MLLRQIRYFITVADCNSFTQAAEQCYISQSAISQQIQALEKELGVQLIVRQNRRFSLTAAGEYFYNRGKVLLDEADELCRQTIRVGKNNELQLRIGYLKGYSGQELYQTIAAFSQLYPEVSIDVVNGTHEELYDLLRFGSVDVVLSDQRRAFSDEYVNFQLLECGCYAELSIRNRLSTQKSVQLEDLKHTPCILISSKEQQNTEQAYYKNTLGFSGSFLFAENLEEGRLMVAGNRGFLPVENLGTLPLEGDSIRRIPIYRGKNPIMRNYCAFWHKAHTNYYIEEFAKMLRKLLSPENK